MQNTKQKSRLFKLEKKHVLVKYFEDSNDIAINDVIVKFASFQGKNIFIDALLDSGFPIEEDK